jgi:tetratricopeptide (TPR) repeat protein
VKPEQARSLVSIIQILAILVPGWRSVPYLNAKSQFLSSAYTTALKFALEATSIMNDSTPFLLLAQIQNKLNTPKQAQQTLEQCLSSYFQVRNDPFYHYVQSQTHRQANRLKDALESCEVGIGVFDSTKHVHRLHFMINMERVRVLHLMKRYQEARATCENCLAEKSLNTNDRAMAHCLLVDIDLAQATSTPDQLIAKLLSFLSSLDNASSGVGLMILRRVASIHRKFRRDEASALRCLKEAAMKYGGVNLQCWMEYGDALIQSSKVDEAIAAYRMAISVIEQKEDSIENLRQVDQLQCKIGQAYIRTHQYAQVRCDSNVLMDFMDRLSSFTFPRIIKGLVLWLLLQILLIFIDYLTKQQMQRNCYCQFIKRKHVCHTIQ